MKKWKNGKRKFETTLTFAATILFSFLTIVFPVHAAEMGEIRSGETKSGNIIIPGQNDSFTFYGNKGNGIAIEVAAMGESKIIPEIYLYRPDGTLEIESITPNCYEQRVRIKEHQLEQVGDYKIVTASRECGGIGEYGLSLTLINGNGGGSVNKQVDINKEIKNDELSCEGSQVMFQGKCIEISSLLKKDEKGISKEEYKSIIEKFDILKKEDKAKLEKLAAYLDDEIHRYLDKREYEEAKTNTSLLETTYYQLEDEKKVNETKKKYEEIKKEHFIYKLTHPFDDPLEVFSTIIFEFLIYFICVFKKIRDKDGKFSFNLMMKYKYLLIAGFMALFVVLWAIVSIVFTMLK